MINQPGHGKRNIDALPYIDKFYAKFEVVLYFEEVDEVL